MEQLNTHHYDGNLRELIDIVGPHINRASLIPRDRKLLSFVILRRTLLADRSFDRAAGMALNTIITTYERHGRIRGGGNYDPSNDLYADDLLYLLYEIVMKKGVADTGVIINQQLSDMLSGMCAQGRTHRLFQLVWALREYL
jgi:hypothetical protein